MAVVRSTDFMRALTQETALATLICQRHPTPSCGGRRSYREENHGPGKDAVESLTPIPELENKIGPFRRFRSTMPYSGVGSIAAKGMAPRHTWPSAGVCELHGFPRGSAAMAVTC